MHMGCIILKERGLCSVDCDFEQIERIRAGLASFSITATVMVHLGESLSQTKI
jgi:hypothetical protein